MGALAGESELKKSVCSKIIDSLASIATKEVASNGIFTLPGFCRIKTRMKPATKAGKRGLWQNSDGQGQAGEEDRQGLPRRCVEGERLNSCCCQRRPMTR